MKNQHSNIGQIDVDYGKLPPQAIDAEQAVLGALMLENEAIQTVSGIVSTNSFYKPEHQKIFEVIQSISNRNKAVDLLLVTQELIDIGQLETVGGAGYITGLTRKVASAAHIEHHARIIEQKYLQREIIRTSTEMLTMAYVDTADVDDLIVQWRKHSNELDNSHTIEDTGTCIQDVLKNTVLEIESDCNHINNKTTPGITTGFPSFDQNTGGWRDGSLIVLAARPGIGKTSFALFFALSAAKAGNWVNIFSFEMNKEDLARIMLATESGVYRSDIRDGYLQSTDWEKLNDAISRLEKLPIIFKDASGMTVSQVQAIIRKNNKNGKCDFAIVDYLQLIKSPKNKFNRELEVSEISRTLKTTALTEKIPILALSQLNREADGKTPKLSNLRESGAIEQDADLVAFLRKPDQDQNLIELIIAKHRRGRLGTASIYYNDEMTRFSETIFQE